MDEESNIFLVEGDTDTTLAGVLTCAELHIPVVYKDIDLGSPNKR
ncbi:MAG: hypothetical protein QXZ09_04625 [Candidatus Methanomethylicaceae archaeon]